MGVNFLNGGWEMEKIGYVLLGIVAVVYLGLMVAGMIAAFPWGLIGLVAMVGVGFLMVKVISDRLASPEDDYYDKNVDQ